MAADQTGAEPVESFEICLDELEKVVKELEAGDLPLERSLELFERGMSLSDYLPQAARGGRDARRNADPQGRQDSRRTVPPRKEAMKA